MTNQAELTELPQFVTFDWLTQLGPLGLIFVFVMFLCYFCRRLRQIPTAWVWPITVIGVLLYLVIAPADVQQGFYVHLTYNFIRGSVVSICGTVTAWGLHDKGFVWLASKWPVLSFLVADNLKPNDPNKP